MAISIHSAKIKDGDRLMEDGEKWFVGVLQNCKRREYLLQSHNQIFLA